MNLPFVLDIAIGLIFIFLVLSLLASELQELLTTLLQWRAKHLKDAIEVLLSGGVGTEDEAHVRDLVDRLYNDPLIKNINQEAKGLAGKFRGITRFLLPNNQRSSFGGKRATGPSYIAPETFATSILERIGLDNLINKLVEIRLEKFAERIVGPLSNGQGVEATPPPLAPATDRPPEVSSDTTSPDPDLMVEPTEASEVTSQSLEGESALTSEAIRVKVPDATPAIAPAATPKTGWEAGRIRGLAQATGWDVDSTGQFLDSDGHFQILVDEFSEILNEFKSGEINLATSVERMGESLSAYIANYPDPDSQQSRTPQTDFIKRLKKFKFSTFGEKSERAVTAGGLRPSLLEIAELLNQSSGVYREVIEAYRHLREKGKQLDDAIYPVLAQELLRNHYFEVEQELLANHLTVLETELQNHNPKALAQALASHQNLQDLVSKKAAQLGLSLKQIRRKRGFWNKLSQWFDLQWQKLSKLQRRWAIARALDQLPDDQELRIVTNVLLRASTLLNATDEEYFRIIDLALNRLTNEERHLLINKALIEVCDEQKWDLKATRSLYDNYQTYKTTQLILRQLPNSVKDSFAILARRAQMRVQRTGNDINQFREEIGVWFDRSMSRASGVYKRNAKGVAIAIGLLLAIISNTDVTFVVDRLSSDESLRQVVTENAVNLQTSNAPAPGSGAPAQSTTQLTPDQLRNLKNQTNAILQEMTLPVGWNPTNLSQQLSCIPSGKFAEAAPPARWPEFYDYCIPNPVKTAPEASLTNKLGAFFTNFMTLAVTYPLSLLRIMFGWAVTGLAISMGAPFWFDLLGKIVNVRNSGGKPSSVETQSVAKPAESEVRVKQ